MHSLFDLDGTLTDPLVEIERSIKHALHELGLQESVADDLPSHCQARRFCRSVPSMEASSAPLVPTRKI
jgi:phosphoglycolate phosphatase-like HAD superfamily hydrolase